MEVGVVLRLALVRCGVSGIVAVRSRCHISD